MKYDPHFGTLVRRQQNYLIDGIPVVVGLSCILHQIHPLATKKLISYLGQYVRTQIQKVFGNSDNELVSKELVNIEIPLDITNILIFLDQLCKFSSIPRATIHEYIPSYIFDAIKIPTKVS